MEKDLFAVGVWNRAVRPLPVEVSPLRHADYLVVHSLFDTLAMKARLELHNFRLLRTDR